MSADHLGLLFHYTQAFVQECTLTRLQNAHGKNASNIQCVNSLPLHLMATWLYTQSLQSQNFLTLNDDFSKVEEETAQMNVSIVGDCYTNTFRPKTVKCFIVCKIFWFAQNCRQSGPCFRSTKPRGHDPLAISGSISYKERWRMMEIHLLYNTFIHRHILQREQTLCAARLSL